MASTGLRTFMFNTLNEDETGYAGTAQKLAIACKLKTSFTTADGGQYGDDELQFEDNAITGGTLSIEVDDDNPEVFAPLLGKTESEVTIDTKKAKEYLTKTTDTPVPIGFGYIIPKRTKNGTKYHAKVFKKITFKPYGDDAETKGEKVSFKNAAIEGTIYPLNDEILWEMEDESLEVVIAYIGKKLNRTSFANLTKTENIKGDGSDTSTPTSTSTSTTTDTSKTSK